MTSETGGSPEAIAHDVRLAVMRLARRLRANRLDSTLTLTQLSALAAVESLGCVTPGELAAAERVQPPSMTRVIATLESAGLLSRAPHPTDGRQALLTITPEGTALLAADRAHREQWLGRRVAELDAADVAALTAALPVLDRLAAG